MNSLFLNKERGHFQINDFLCSYDFIKNIEEIDVFPSEVIEIEYNEFVDRKYYINSDLERLELSSPLEEICLYLIDKLEVYSSLFSVTSNQTTLEEIISARKLQIRYSMGALIYAPIEFNEQLFWASEIAQKNIIAKISLVDNVLDNVNWLDTNDNPVEFSYEDFKSFARAIESRSSSLYFQEALKNKELKDILERFNNKEITFQQSLIQVSEVSLTFV